MPTLGEVAVEIALAEDATGVFETAKDNRGRDNNEYSFVANRTIRRSVVREVRLLGLRSGGPPHPGREPAPQRQASGKPGGRRRV
jgi:hypothetical protein